MKKVVWVVITIILFFFVGFCFFKGQVKTINNKNDNVNQVAKVLNSNTDRTYFVYFTGVGCPHCANVDPVLLKKKVREKNIMVIEYEIYQQRQNGPLLMGYNDEYNTGLGVPLLIAGDCKEKAVVGDKSILKDLDQTIKENQGNCIVLPDNKISFEELNISNIPGLPKIWYKNRLAVKQDLDSKENEFIKDFLVKGIIPKEIKSSDNTEAVLSGDSVKFKNAVELDGWILMYN